MSEESKVNLPAFIGVKAGMTRVFDQDGNHVPVTVVKLISNFISQVKTVEKDGYEAYQLTYSEKKDKLVPKPIKGHLAKSEISKSFTRFTELRMEGVEPSNLGKEVSISDFDSSTYVDVTGISKGKGFQGVMKRHNFSGGPASHGSHFHRVGGSIGNRATPGKVFAGKKMPGHMGSERKTVQNLKVFAVNMEKGYLLIKGSVPGAKNGFIRIAKALKK
jgi:large subunit ribosomal protein L3